MILSCCYLAISYFSVCGIGQAETQGFPLSPQGTRATVSVPVRSSGSGCFRMDTPNNQRLLHYVRFEQRVHDSIIELSFSFSRSRIAGRGPANQGKFPWLKISSRWVPILYVKLAPALTRASQLHIAGALSVPKCRNSTLHG